MPIRRDETTTASITRKRFLIGAGTTAGATLFTPFVARTARPVVIKFGADQPVHAPLTKYAVMAADQLKKETDGELELQVFPNKRLSADHQKLIATVFDAQALKQRVFNETLDNSLQGKLTSQGLTFNEPDPAPFRALLVKNGFYSEWQKKFGSELWSALEKYTGTLA